jgi:hypothetical protein
MIFRWEENIGPHSGIKQAGNFGSHRGGEGELCTAADTRQIGSQVKISPERSSL